jgi:pimeloyl-ACP methyl ester carboxylesterase
MAAELSGAARTPDVLPEGADAVIEIPSNGQKNGSYYPVPLIVGLRVSFRLMNASAPLAALVAKRLFFRPRRKRARKLEAEDVELSEVRVNGKRVQIYEFGAGPPVLIVHGWESSVSRLAPLIRDIVAAGFRVVTFDNPAHGESGGVDTDPIEVTTVIHHLAARHGVFAAGVAHSFGAACLANALREGLVCERLVLFAAPASVDMIISMFSLLLGLSPDVRSRLRALIAQRFEPLIIERDLDVAASIARAALPTLILHDLADKSVPFDEARRLRSLHPGARLVATKGLSHYGVIRDPRAIAACLEFLGQSAASRRRSDTVPTGEVARREAC